LILERKSGGTKEKKIKIEIQDEKISSCHRGIQPAALSALRNVWIAPPGVRGMRALQGHSRGGTEDKNKGQ
jgi:hypothetical protein